MTCSEKPLIFGNEDIVSMLILCDEPSLGTERKLKISINCLDAVLLEMKVKMCIKNTAFQNFLQHPT